jgi:hypothetical protein
MPWGLQETRFEELGGSGLRLPPISSPVRSQVKKEKRGSLHFRSTPKPITEDGELSSTPPIGVPNDSTLTGLHASVN